MNIINEIIKERDFDRHKNYMNIAINMANMSRSKRNHVGCLLVSNDGRIISSGFNGTPSKFSRGNVCENDENETYKYVLHAELNTILNCRETDLQGSIMYLTLSPCQHCAAIIIQKKISMVIFNEKYRDESGIELLIENDIKVIQI